MERVWHRACANHAQAVLDAADYIVNVHNAARLHARLHARLGYRSPAKSEREGSLATEPEQSPTRFIRSVCPKRLDRATGDWFTVAQHRIDGFARRTGDDFWIHVDRKHAARGQ